MHPDEFTDRSPGELVPITGGWAYLARPLPPPPLAVTWAFASRVEDAARALATAGGVSAEIGNKELLIRPLVTREAVSSNRIEGTHTQAEDVLRAQEMGPPRDRAYAALVTEVERYLAVTKMASDWAAEGRPLSAFVLRALHRELLAGTRGEDRRPGEFRRQQVVIGQPGDTPVTATFVPAPPEHIEGLVENLLAFAAAPEDYPALVVAAILHYQFETIHPFEDGNGRLGRLIIPIYLMSRGFTEQPIVNLSPFLDAHRREYLDLMKRVSTHGDWESWIRFFLDAVQAQAVDVATRAETLRMLRERYRVAAKAASRSQAAMVAVDYVMERVFVTASAFERAHRYNYRTARAAIEALASAGIVKEIEGSYPQAWYAAELIELAYGD
ncbi:MAG: Fic family protein [Dehalococcoidia bacterium]